MRSKSKLSIHRKKGRRQGRKRKENDKAPKGGKGVKLGPSSKGRKFSPTEGPSAEANQ